MYLCVTKANNYKQPKLKTKIMSIETTVAAPVQISISAVQQMLAAGKDRKAIAEHFGLTKAEIKRVFMNPKLKGKKVKKAITQRDAETFVLVDDTTETNATSETTSSTPVATEQPAGEAAATPAATTETEETY